MEFISIKNESKEFIYYFCNWWADNNKDTDLVEIILRNGPEINMYGRIKHCHLILGREYFPVATEGQARQFIEYKTGHKVPNSLPIEIWLYVNKGIKRMSSIDKFDALQAYLKVALEVAEDNFVTIK